MRYSRAKSHSTDYMKRTLISECPGKIGTQVCVRGWLNNVRSLGKVNFVVLRDRSGLGQIVVEDKDEFAKIRPLFSGTVLKITGEVVSSPKALLGVEIINPKLWVESAVTEPPPLEYYRHEMKGEIEHILDHRPIALRNIQEQAVFRIQGELAHAFRLYMHDTVGAYEYFGPNMIGASSEGGAEFFNVDYFGYNATLAQSSQLYKQIMVGVNERVFAIMPFFRAENSNTARHLTEGKQLEFEMGFFERWEEVMDVEEGLIKFMVERISTHCKHELEALGVELVKAPANVPFPRLTFAEAQQLYFERSGVDDRTEPDLSPAAERALCEWSMEKFGTELVFVTDWKTSKRPFYSYPKDGDPELTNTFDLLCAGSEITSGGQRRHTYQSMIDGILAKGMDPAAFDDYLSIFKFGMPPHGGFGLGLERLTMTMLRLKNIREASLFPSDPKRIAGIKLKAKIFFGEESVRNEIIRILRDQGIEFKHVKHEATPTSEASALARGTKLEEGVKALLLRGKTTKKNYQINIPADKKVNMKAVAEALGEKCEFESPEVIEERFGLKVGGIPPFGHLFNVETYFDNSITSLTAVSFNCGLLTESIVMPAAALVEAVQPKLGNFAQ